MSFLRRPLLAVDYRPSFRASGARPTSELRRLQLMLPPELSSWVDIHATGSFQASLVRCAELGGDRVAIELDLPRWEQLPLDQRDMLFWHYVARIQSDTVPRDGWEKTAVMLGLGGALGEIWVRDGVLLLVAIAVVAVAGFRLYRRSRSADELQAAIAADRKAIQLASQYSRRNPFEAERALESALLWLRDEASSARQKARYQTRLSTLGRGSSDSMGNSTGSLDYWRR